MKKPPTIKQLRANLLENPIVKLALQRGREIPTKFFNEVLLPLNGKDDVIVIPAKNIVLPVKQLRDWMKHTTAETVTFKLEDDGLRVEYREDSIKARALFKFYELTPSFIVTDTGV